MIEFEDHRPPAPPAALADAERRLAARGHRIPPSYRAFLAEQDGGRPVKDTFYFEQHDRRQSSGVSAFLGVQPRPGGSLTSDLASVVEVVGDIPPGILPIAHDEVGNLICIDTRDGRDGPVMFRDHEEGFDDDEVDYSNLYEIAPDLQTFLDGLTEAPPLEFEPVVISRRGGVRRLFRRR
jgi:cell wall assembly regulator SMI1